MCEIKLTWEWDFEHARYKDHPVIQEDCSSPRLSINEDRQFMNCSLSIANVTEADGEGEWECTVGHWSLGTGTNSTNC